MPNTDPTIVLLLAVAIGLGVLCLFFLMLLWAGLSSLRSQLDRLPHVEDKLDRLLSHTPEYKSSSLNRPEPADDGYPPDIVAALRNGQTIEAVKLHRERYGTSLRESKQAIEELLERIHQSPG